jgi:hypothetical protein
MVYAKNKRGTVVDNPLEKVIETKVCDYAKSKGMLAYKFTSPNRAAVPDRMFITASGGKVWFAEFKRLGKKPTPQQTREIQRMRDRDIKVFVIDNIEDGKKLIDDISSKNANT